MDVIELDKARFCIISKSGGTAETMSQYLIVSEALKEQVGADWSEAYHRRDRPRRRGT